MKKWCAALLAVLSGCVADPRPVADTRPDAAGVVTKGPRDWSNVSINAMIDKYGPPDKMETTRVVWNRRGPWKRIVVYDSMEFFERDPGNHNLEQTAVYHVPADKVDALKEFSGNISVSGDDEEISSRSTDEGRNFLTLNLADSIVRGKLDPEAARAAYDRTLQLSDAGKSSPLMNSLQFPPGD